MTKYTLKKGHDVVCHVEVHSPAWFPFKPKISVVWLKSLINRAWSSVVNA